jgi:ketosteroid isomerase-like protein
MDTNREIVANFYKSIVEGDMNLYGSLIHDDVELCMPFVEGVLSGTYFGFCKNYKIMSADEKCVATIFEAEGVTKNGERYDQIYAHFFKFKAGQIIQLIEFNDSSLADRVLWKDTPRLNSDSEFTY